MKNISADNYGYRVEMMRNGIKFDSFIRFDGDRAGALKKAIAIRDDFRARADAIRPRSNTGVAGVTELTHWTRGYPQTCFVVTHGKPCRNWKRRFFYHTLSQRQRALRAAVAHRARLSGEPIHQLLEAANV